MGNPIGYSTIDQQIQKLLSQNLTIDNIDLAKSQLETYGYSSLIKSYREPYIFTGTNGIEYRDGVTFEQVSSLYFLDKNLRSAVISSMLDLEEHTKSVSASVIAEAFGTASASYLSFKNYQNKRKRKPQFTLNTLLGTLRTALNSSKDPIHHCMVTHGDVPPWILFKGVYFSTVVNFIDQFKQPEKDKLAQHLYDVNNIGLSPQQLRTLMMDTLYVCNEYRNNAAHGSRIYSLDCSPTFRETQIFNTTTPNLHGIALLLAVLNYYQYKNPYTTLYNAIQHEINRHCSKYPSDVTYLGQILRINIVVQQMVFISDNSSHFHCNPHCSGIKGVKPIPLNEALSLGYTACKRCASKIKPI